jgi:hypothetical protein
MLVHPGLELAARVIAVAGLALPADLLRSPHARSRARRGRP